jgi:serine/threonine-protein kinase
MFADRGSTLGKYRLIAEIARGGMGVVYLANVQGPGGFNKLVVVKELKPDLVEEPTFLTMFLDEARLAARLSHPNIVQTNEVGSDGSRYFIAMEYLEGRCLDDVRRRVRTAGLGLSPAMQLRVISDILAGLEYAHKLTDFDGTPLNIVHRDVSPQNVFLTFNGHIKLLDFGIAKASDSSHETNAGVLKGKVSYMSPEQARGHKVDARADVFSAGVMLWEALTGRRLRAGQSEQEKMWALVAGDLPRASTVRPTLPRQLDDMCARAMAWNRDERYQSAGEFQRDLDRYIGETGTAVSSREIGDCVQRMFHEDRAKISALIDAHVARARTGAGTVTGLLPGQLPVIGVRLHGSRAGSLSDRPSTVAPLSSPEPEKTPSASSDQLSVAAPSGPSKPAHASSRKPLLVAGAAAATTLAVAAVVGLWPSGGPGNPMTNTQAAPPPTHVPLSQLSVDPTPPPVAPPAAAPPPRPLVNVEVRVSPPTATLTIDDIELVGNPFAGRYTTDTAVHHVRATASGYVTKTVTVTFDANVRLDLSLERVQREPSPPPPPERPRPSVIVRSPPPAEVARPREPAPDPSNVRPSASSDIDPTGGNRPRRPIDPNNPYGAAGNGRPIDPNNPYGGSR